jgi:bifunctional non-homologous end joining protein LigD
MARPENAKAKGEGLLDDYRKKRDFSRTGEPDGSASSKKREDLRFVVQKHAARRLHYDFRLEWDGVLKSWAITRGPSLDPAEKRLAVRTEDHPLDYGSFEGTIPKGEYGGGAVMLWDQGRFEPLHDPEEGLKEGKLHFRLHGERMKGGWALVRMRNKGKEKRENWLMVKERDELADEHADLLAEHETSVSSGRTMAEIRKEKPKRSKAERLPGFQPPELATLVSEVPAGRDWLHELKYDGYRCLIACAGEQVRCYTRNGKDWTARFAGIAEAAKAIGAKSALIDGEVVAFGKDGGTDFSSLQKVLKSGGDLSFFAFDLLALDGDDLTGTPLIERKQSLQKLIEALPKTSAIQYSEHVRGSGEQVLQKVCAAGHEGLIAKRADAPYAGRRSKAWLKIKCTRRQEFVIGGWSPSDKRGRRFASLLVGVYENGRLRYAGRVGTGFDQDDQASLGDRLRSLARKTSPFEEVPALIAKNARWVTPKLVAEVAFAEFTSDGAVRHGAYLGLRGDKPATAVATERADDVEDRGMDDDQPVERSGVRLSHPDKVLFPSQGLTKLDLADYYAAIAGRMLPLIEDRPLSLVRCPQGRGRKCFYQKHDSGGFPDVMKSLEIEEGSGKKEDYFYIDAAEGLIAAVQMGVLEFHVWGSRRDRIERPDRLVFDLDPDESLGFEEVRGAAFDLRAKLKELGLETLAMVTGGKGLHLIAPLERRAGWDEVKAFAKGFAATLAEAEPERFTATMSKQKRKGRIFIDWLRNERGATAIAPYSTRARQGAPVAMPIAWDELEALKRADGFSVAEAMERLKVGDPWAEASTWRQTITRKMLQATGAG